MEKKNKVESFKKTGLLITERHEFHIGIDLKPQNKENKD